MAVCIGVIGTILSQAANSADPSSIQKYEVMESQSEEPSESLQPEETETESSIDSHVNVGQTVDVDGLIITFVAAESYESDNEFIEPKETNDKVNDDQFLEDKDFQKPLEDFFLKNSSSVKIFVESDDFDTAKNNAVKLKEYINNLDENVQVNLYSKNYDDILDIMIKYKYQLLPKDIRNYLLNDEADIVAENLRVLNEEGESVI